MNKTSDKQKIELLQKQVESLFNLAVLNSAYIIELREITGLAPPQKEKESNG